MKSISTTCALGMVLSLAVGATLAAGQASSKPAAKPTASHPWTSFNPGTWVKMKSTTLMDVAGRKNTSVIETKITLLEKTADKVVLETEMTVMGQTTKTKADLALKGYSDAVPAGVTVLKKGTDTITIAGKSVGCDIMESTMDAGGTKVQSKTWTSKQIPGALVKSVSTTPSTQTTMEVVDFKAM